MMQMGYVPPPTAQDIAMELERKRKGLAEMNIQDEEFRKIMAEIKADEAKPVFRTEYWKSQDFMIRTKPYWSALQGLKNMLEGRVPVSLKDAYYQMEAAYGEAYLSKKEYDKGITEDLKFIRTWLSQNGYSLKNNEALHFGIHKFMSDTLTVKVKQPDSELTTTVTHYPFMYDYNDFTGEKDHRNFFVTKFFATGTGQCSTMPSAYLIYAEGLGVPAYLTYLPIHSFVKFKDNKGTLHNYEPTSNWEISDQWYMDNFGVSQKAVSKGVYLDTLGKRQIVADCLLEMAFGYLRKYGVADGVFATDCINTALKEFPKKNNLTAYFLIGSMYEARIKQLMYEKRLTNIEDAAKVPEIKRLYNAMLENEKHIVSLGYQDMRKQDYDALMQQHEFKGRRQAATGYNTKEKRTLFVKQTQ